ncbi:putative late blight resistance protein homolog R1A-3 [Salvia hispanica]|uniref:putative late blight resistance protein homolog R1A-3 n=1 Tax=Salvia hispanica TaxID=49212 RepID=UPI00200989C0|nr:putative late blight resistance protein homolog R1A-3 [Salvia hispanica]
MAATAYASLVSSLNTIDQIKIHPHLSTCFDNYQFQSLLELVDFLVDFVENYSEAEDLMSRIRDAAHEAEDIIEVEAADQIRNLSTRKSLPMLLRRLEKIMQEMSSIKEKAVKFKEETGSLSSMPPLPPSSSPSSSASGVPKKTTMLGFDHYVAQLLDELIGYNGRRTLPIVGMGGVGKTTLARHVYENSLVVYHFDVRVWVTVSQDYNATDMLSQALSCLGLTGSENRTDHELGEKLYKSLSGQRYLIVLDDAWSIGAWDNIKSFFPENGNGSRIIVTTRQQELVDYFGSSSLAIDFLDYKNGWDLLYEVTFAEQKCPPQLERIAEEIIRKCRGLPLAIRVIGGLLGKAPRTLEYWEEIAKDKSLVMEYSDYRINVAHLIKLWVAEGLIKPTKTRSLEQVARSYIIDLIHRNLLIVEEFEYGNITSCCLHDLVRELCIHTAENENFYRIQRDIGEERQFIFDKRSASFYPRESLTSKKPSVITPLILSRQRDTPLRSRLLRVLVDDHESTLQDSFQQVNLRYISHHSHLSTPAIPFSISLCWSLQTLIVKRSSPFDLITTALPSEIWKMSQLRHIEISEMKLPDPPQGGVFVLHNLQTLKTVEMLVFSEDVCARIPNVRELDIEYRLEEETELGWCFHLHNVGRLSKLESLSIRCRGGPHVEFENLKLPDSLSELNLDNCYMAWSGMAMMASLPHLQLLRFHWNAVVGPEWEFVDEKFCSLKHLIISNCHNLIRWTVDKFNFPVLETLFLSCLRKLDEIPLDIGEVPTLEKISVVNCSESVKMSAMKILEEQENLGNQSLQVIIDGAVS